MQKNQKSSDTSDKNNNLKIKLENNFIPSLFLSIAKSQNYHIVYTKMIELLSHIEGEISLTIPSCIPNNPSKVQTVKSNTLFEVLE